MDDSKKVLLVDGGDIDKKLKLATQNLHYVNVLPSIVSSMISVLEVWVVKLSSVCLECLFFLVKKTTPPSWNAGPQRLQYPPAWHPCNDSGRYQQNRRADAYPHQPLARGVSESHHCFLQPATCAFSFPVQARRFPVILVLTWSCNVSCLFSVRLEVPTEVGGKCCGLL